MNLLDIVILAMLAGFLIKGLLRGLLRELCSLLGLFGGLFLALRYHAPLAELLLDSFGWPSQVCVIAAFTALFLLTVLFFALLGFLLSRFVKLLFLGGFNRVAGGLFGLVQGGVLATLVLFGLSRSPLPRSVQTVLEQSQLAPPLIRFGETLLSQGRDAITERALPSVAGKAHEKGVDRSGSP
jgi:membrane protein required for colicin V production